mgnify:CR=1 FL=1
MTSWPSSPAGSLPSPPTRSPPSSHSICHTTEISALAHSLPALKSSPSATSTTSSAAIVYSTVSKNCSSARRGSDQSHFEHQYPYSYRKQPTQWKITLSRESKNAVCTCSPTTDRHCILLQPLQLKSTSQPNSPKWSFRTPICSNAKESGFECRRTDLRLVERAVTCVVEDTEGDEEKVKNKVDGIASCHL